MVENMNDIPYVRAKDIGAETVSMMTKICTSVRQMVPYNIPCGLQVRKNCIILILLELLINNKYRYWLQQIKKQLLLPKHLISNLSGLKVLFLDMLLMRVI